MYSIKRELEEVTRSTRSTVQSMGRRSKVPDRFSNAHLCMTFPRQLLTQLIPDPIALCVMRLDAEPLKALVLHGPYIGID